MWFKKKKIKEDLDPNRPRRIFITAGESSGDTLGSSLVREMKKQAKFPLVLHGVGGEQMAKEGVQSLFPMNELSVMGIVEVLPNLWNILSRIKQTAKHYIQNDYDALITIDSPDFSFRVAKIISEKKKAKGIRIHYVAPTVWAWREKRAKKIAKYYHSIFCLFPFEPEYFEAYGMMADCVGHSIMDHNQYQRSLEQRNNFRRFLGIKKNERVLGVLFGSRQSEIKRMGDDFVDGIKRFVEDKGSPIFLVAVTLPHLKIQVAEKLNETGCPFIIVDDHDAKWDAYNAMDAAIAVSGTVGLELAVAGVPHFVCYKMNPITAMIVKKNIKVKYAHLASIMLDKRIVPELIQGHCKGRLIAVTLKRLWKSPEFRKRQKIEFNNIRPMLKGSPHKEPSELAASYVLSMIE